LRRWIPVLALAFVVGALFRLGNELGIGALRMFGTQGIVVIGVLVAANVKRLQTEEGLRRLDEHLRALPRDVNVRPLGMAAGHPLWLVEGKGRRIVLGTSAVANSVRAGRAFRLLQRDAEAMLQAAAEHGVAADEVTAVLVLLRRAVGPDGRIEVGTFQRPVALVNPESIVGLFESGP